MGIRKMPESVDLWEVLDPSDGQQRFLGENIYQDYGCPAHGTLSPLKKVGMMYPADQTPRFICNACGNLWEPPERTLVERPNNMVEIQAVFLGHLVDAHGNQVGVFDMRTLDIACSTCLMPQMFQHMLCGPEPGFFIKLPNMGGDEGEVPA